MMPDKNELVERLYRLHFKKLFIYANAVLRDPEQAKDVVQDTFHEALRCIDVVAKHENPGGWLMKVIKNKIKECERSRRRDLRRLLSLDSNFPDESSLPEDLVAAQPEPQGESVIEILERYLRRKSSGSSNGWCLTVLDTSRLHRSLVFPSTPARSGWKGSGRSCMLYFQSGKGGRKNN